MLKKYLIPAGVVIALSLLLVAAYYYPGGSQYSQTSVGYDWKNNYLSNLFGPTAVNGAVNTARPWAVAGMLVLCGVFAWFFIEFSKKIPSKTSANLIRYFGAGGMLLAFLAVTPYHDLMVTLSTTATLVSMFYITIFILKSELQLLKILSVVCMLIIYLCSYVYGTRNGLQYLPVLQKTSLLINIAWVLCLQYFTTAADFEPRKVTA